MSENLENSIENWKFVEFGSLLIGGTRTGIYKSKQFHGFGIKMINMGELFAHPRLKSVPMERIQLTEEEKNRFDIQVGDLIFARRSLVAEGAGKCSIVCEVLEPTTFESSIIRARPNPELVDSFFLFYLFNSPFGKHLLGTIRRQVAVSGITGSDLVNLKIPIPPLSVQRQIAHILTSLDDKIELNQNINETLDVIARAHFDSWLINFDPVRAKSEGKKPEGIEEKLASLLPSEFEILNGWEIPKGWKVTSIDHIATFLNGIALQKFPPENDEYLPVIKIAQLRKGNTESSDKASTKIPSKYIIEDGDILFSWSGSLEVVIWCGGRGALNQHLFKVSSESYPKWFYYLWVRHHLPSFQQIAEGKATTMGHIQRHHLTDAMVFVPSDREIAEMDKILMPILDKIIVHKIESQILSELRESLLPKLMSGKITIRSDNSA